MDSVDGPESEAWCRAIVILEGTISVNDLASHTLVAESVHELSTLGPVTIREYKVEKGESWCVAVQLARQMRSPGWYAHLHCGDSLLVAFPHTVVEVRRGNDGTAALARRVGALFEIPDTQMRFEEMFDVDHPDRAQS